MEVFLTWSNQENIKEDKKLIYFLFLWLNDENKITTKLKETNWYNCFYPFPSILSRLLYFLYFPSIIII